MLLYIHNLPSKMTINQIRKLIYEVCGIQEIVLDEGIPKGNSKRVTVGVADELQANLVSRKINGLFIDGNKLYVEEFKSKPPNISPKPSSSLWQPNNQCYSAQSAPQSSMIQYPTSHMKNTMVPANQQMVPQNNMPYYMSSAQTDSNYGNTNNTTDLGQSVQSRNYIESFNVPSNLNQSHTLSGYQYPPPLMSTNIYEYGQNFTNQNARTCSISPKQNDTSFGFNDDRGTHDELRAQSGQNSLNVRVRPNESWDQRDRDIRQRDRRLRQERRSVDRYDSRDQDHHQSYRNNRDRSSGRNDNRKDREQNYGRIQSRNDHDQYYDKGQNRNDRDQNKKSSNRTDRDQNYDRGFKQNDRIQNNLDIHNDRSDHYDTKRNQITTFELPKLFDKLPSNPGQVIRAFDCYPPYNAKVFGEKRTVGSSFQPPSLTNQKPQQNVSFSNNKPFKNNDSNSTVKQYKFQRHVSPRAVNRNNDRAPQSFLNRNRKPVKQFDRTKPVKIRSQLNPQLATVKARQRSVLQMSLNLLMEVAEKANIKKLPLNVFKNIQSHFKSSVKSLVFRTKETDIDRLKSRCKHEYNATLDKVREYFMKMLRTNSEEPTAPDSLIDIRTFMENATDCDDTDVDIPGFTDQTTKEETHSIDLIKDPILPREVEYIGNFVANRVHKVYKKVLKGQPIILPHKPLKKMARNRIECILYHTDTKDPDAILELYLKKYAPSEKKLLEDAKNIWPASEELPAIIAPLIKKASTAKLDISCASQNQETALTKPATEKEIKSAAKFISHRMHTSFRQIYFGKVPFLPLELLQKAVMGRVRELMISTNERALYGLLELYKGKYAATDEIFLEDCLKILRTNTTKNTIETGPNGEPSRMDGLIASNVVLSSLDEGLQADIKTELEPIKQLYIECCEPADNDVKEHIRKEFLGRPFMEFMQTLTTCLSVRFLEKPNLSVHISYQRQPPKQELLEEFLIPFNVVILHHKSSKYKKHFLAGCEDFEGFDRLNAVGCTTIDGVELSFKPGNYENKKNLGREAKTTSKDGEGMECSIVGENSENNKKITDKEMIYNKDEEERNNTNNEIADNDSKEKNESNDEHIGEEKNIVKDNNNKVNNYASEAQVLNFVENDSLEAQFDENDLEDF